MCSLLLPAGRAHWSWRGMRQGGHEEKYQSSQHCITWSSPTQEPLGLGQTSGAYGLLAHGCSVGSSGPPQGLQGVVVGAVLLGEHDV